MFVKYNLEQLVKGDAEGSDLIRKKDIIPIVKTFETEGFTVSEWELFEAVEVTPETGHDDADRVYGFQKSSHELVYLRMLHKGDIQPHYFKHHGEWGYSAVDADSIQEAVRLFEP